MARRAVEYAELDLPVCALQCRIHPCRATAAGVFVPAAALTYNFDDGTSSLNGWTQATTSGGPPTLVGGAAYATFSQNSATGARMQVTVGFTGLLNNKVRLNLRRTANGGSFTGTVVGVTASGIFTKSFSNPLLDEDTTIVVDMTTATPSGGESGLWINKTFTSLRVFFDASGTGVFRVYSIDIGSLSGGAVDKCFNTLSTCQDEPRYDETEATVRFVKDNGALDLHTIYALPIITSVSFVPGTLAIGESIGERSTLTVQLKDRPHSDAGPGFDPYYAERSYDPYKQGTLLGKFRARQPYLQDRLIRYIRGYSDQALADMETRTFVITKAQMTGMNGGFVIEAQDALRMVDRTRALAPVPNNGYLSVDINDSVTSFTLAPSGIGNAEYAVSGHVNIGGKEIVSFTRAGDVMTIVRARLGTVASAHSAQDRVQQILYEVSQDPADIIYRLIVNFSNVPAGWIPLSEWQLETASFLQVNYTGIVADPTPVDKLITELCKQCALTVWWDDLRSKLQLQVLRGISSVATITEANRINGSFIIEDQPEKRVTQVHVYYGKVNPLESDDKTENYRSIAKSFDLQIESLVGGTPSIVEIFSRWIPAGGRSIALRLGELILGRYKTPPRLFKFNVMQRDDNVRLELAEGVDIESWALQAANGAGATIQGQVIRNDMGLVTPRIELEEFTFSASSTSISDRTIIIETNEYNLDLRARYDSLYPEPTTTTVVDVYILSGVAVGSISTALRALDVGSWPTGCVINIYIDGRIQGKGGKGGDGDKSGSDRHGLAGGPALYTRHPINIFGTGKIYGGGGGGGGGQIGFNLPSTSLQGGRGGGGAGFDGGLAGSGKNPNNPGTMDAGGVGGQNTSGSGSNAGAGGNGGGPGQAGQNGGGGGGGNGGAAGAAIDGNSYVTEGGSLTVTGGRIN